MSFACLTVGWLDLFVELVAYYSPLRGLRSMYRRFHRCSDFETQNSYGAAKDHNTEERGFWYLLYLLLGRVYAYDGLLRTNMV